MQTKQTNISEDDIRDLAIRICDELVANGIVPDCTDTSDETEFITQDIIFSNVNKFLQQ